MITLTKTTCGDDTKKDMRAMIQVTFTLRTLTPLFLAGADQSQAELRAPAFRGLMRYWLRTILGNLVKPGTRDIQRVIKGEEAVFGATDSSSPIRVKIVNTPVKTEMLELEGRNRQSATGRDYLLWSVLRSRRRCIPQQTTFQVALAIRSQNEDREREALKCAVSSFWLLTHLGGIGSRSRRCAGSLSITHVQGDTFDFPFDMPASVTELQIQLEQGIAKARAQTNHTSQRQEAFFDTLSPGTCHIWILLNNNQPWTDANQALRDIGKKLQSYRDSLSPIERRKIFGIPVMVLERGRSLPLRVSGAGSRYKRMASPLHLRLSEIRNGQIKQYVGIATLFKTRWEDMSATDYQLYQLIENWIEQDFPQARKVTF